MVRGHNKASGEEQAYIIDKKTKVGVQYIDGAWVQTDEK